MPIDGAIEAWSRIERFGSVGSTNDIIRGWLAAGIPEVCVATADEQTAGRGRAGRRWLAPPGAALLCSLGFTPNWLEADDAWRLGAIVALAMADAAEQVAGLAEGAIRLKWPNDLVIAASPGLPPHDQEQLARATAPDRHADPLRVRKLAGVLGESEDLGTSSPRVVIGIGLNADWAAADFPPALAGSMTSLREVSGGRPIDRTTLLDEFLGRLETRVAALRAGRFDVAGWTERQATTGRLVTVVGLDGVETTTRALGVDGRTGALIVETAGDAAAGDETAGDGDRPAGRGTAGPRTGRERSILAGEVRHLRLPSDEPV